MRQWQRSDKGGQGRPITVEQIASANRRPDDQTQDADRAWPQQAQPPAHAGGYAGRARHDQQAFGHLVRVVDEQAPEESLQGSAGVRCGSTSSKTIPGRASCACASAAASARASARRAAAAARARRPAPASPSAASKAARCRCIAACPSAASTSATASTSTRSTSAACRQAVDDSRLDAGKPVDVAALVAAGLVRRALDGVRLLGDGELKAKLALTVNHATRQGQGGGREGRRLDDADREEGAGGRRGQAQEDRRPRRPTSAKKPAGGKPPRNRRWRAASRATQERAPVRGIEPRCRAWDAAPDLSEWTLPRRRDATGAKVRERRKWFPPPSSLPPISILAPLPRPRI